MGVIIPQTMRSVVGRLDSDVCAKHFALEDALAFFEPPELEPVVRRIERHARAAIRYHSLRRARERLGRVRVVIELQGERLSECVDEPALRMFLGQFRRALAYLARTQEYIGALHREDEEHDGNEKDDRKEHAQYMHVFILAPYLGASTSRPLRESCAR